MVTKSTREGEGGGGAATDPTMEDDKVEEALKGTTAAEEEVVVTEVTTLCVHGLAFVLAFGLCCVSRGDLVIWICIYL